MGIEQLNIRDADQNKEILKEFFLSEHGQFINGEMQKSNVDSEIDRRLAGILFEKIAYRWMKRQTENNNVFLSPEEVFKLWTALYPDAKVESHGGFNSSIRGISVPDGLMIKEEPNNLAIFSVVEYKIVSNKKKEEIYPQIKRQARHFRQDVFAKELEDVRISGKMGKVVHEMHKELHGKPLTVDLNLKLIYVVPQDCFLHINNSTLKYAPVTKQQLFQMKESLFKKALSK